MSYNYDQETGILRTYKKKDKDNNVDISNNTWHFACARDFLHSISTSQRTSASKYSKPQRRVTDKETEVCRG